MRIGWEDSDGPNWFAVVIRPDIWFAVTIIFGLIIIPKLTLWPRGRIGTAKTVLFSAPVTLLLAVFFASALSVIKYNQAFDYFGFDYFAKSVLCIGLGLLVFNLTLASRRFASTMINLLTWSPLITIMVGVFTMIVLIGNIDGFDKYVTDAYNSLGFVGYSGRFQGLASHPNIVMTQSGIALALLIPRILQLSDEKFWLRVFLLFYAIALTVVIVWSGVRAALVIIPIVFIIAVWLRFRPTAQSLLAAVLSIAKSSVFFIFVWIVVSSMDLDEVLVERLKTDDGRLFLWVYYFKMLFENPFGLGFAFETIAGTDLVIEGQRLPPHNALLQAGMYGGFIAVIVSLFLLGKVGLAIARLRYRGRLSNELLGLILAWCTLVLALMVGGVISADYYFSILTALLLAPATRPVPQAGRCLLPVSRSMP